MVAETIYLHTDGYVSTNPANAVCEVTVDCDEHCDWRDLFVSRVGEGKGTVLVNSRVSYETFRRRLAGRFDHPLIIRFPNESPNIVTPDRVDYATSFMRQYRGADGSVFEVKTVIVQ